MEDSKEEKKNEGNEEMKDVADAIPPEKEKKGHPLDSGFFEFETICHKKIYNDFCKGDMLLHMLTYHLSLWSMAE